MRKKMLAFLSICLFTTVFSQNFDLSTLRIGPFNLKMNMDDADKVAGKRLSPNSDDSGNFVNYNGEMIEVYVYGSSDLSNRTIGQLKTTSIKFRTKSGIGVGSTRDQLIDAYRNFSSFTLYPEWDENGKRREADSIFTLNDVEAGSAISFKMRNNVVVEVMVYLDEGGC